MARTKKKTFTFYVNENCGVALKPMGEDDDHCFCICPEVLKKLGVSTIMEKKHKDQIVNAEVTITVDSVEYGILEPATPIWKLLKERK